MKALQANRELQRAIRRSLQGRPLFLGALAAAPFAALAGPTGGEVVAGEANIDYQGAGTLIDQATQRAVINWDSFNVGAEEYVLFQQPSSSAVILNRVIGGDPSSILGRISANGQVFLVNPNGIFFGAGAQLDVQGLLATTLDIDDADFMAGNDAFSGTGEGAVVNEGRITAAEGGYVVLAADRVDNSGLIAARAGAVVMAAGSAVTLDVNGDGLVNFAVDEAALSDMAGVRNAGSLLADGGVVLMTAKTASDLVATTVNNEGLVRARSIEERDGVIILSAEGGDIANAGTLDADGMSGNAGGIVYLRGDRNIDLKDGSVITAAGDGQASGGMVRAIAEDTLWFREDAAIRATGGNANGGFVEVSGHGSIYLQGAADIGTGGMLLIDPSVLTIGTGSGVPSYGGVGVGWIEGQLNANADVLLLASNSIGAVAGVTAVNATGTGGLEIAIGTTTDASCNLAGACSPPVSYTPTNGGSINLSGVDINIAGNFNAVAQQGNVNLGNVTTTGGAINIIGDRGISVGSLDAAGNITLDAAGASFGVFDNGVSVGGNLTAGGSVNITAIGSASYGGGGVFVSGNLTAGGAVSVLGSGASFDSININGSVSGASVSLQNLNFSGGSVRVDGNAGAGITATAGDVVIDAAQGGAFIASSGGETGQFGQSVSAAGDFVVNANGDIVAGAVNAGGDVRLDTGSIGSRILIGTETFFPSNTFTYADIIAGGEVSLNVNALSGGYIKAGNISGTDIFVRHAGASADIRLGGLTANDGAGRAMIDVVTGDSISTGAVGNISIEGDISATGQAESGSCGSFGDCLGPGNQPFGAHVQLRAGPGFGSNAGIITVNGNVSITATPVNVSVVRTTESSTTSVNGLAGMADLYVRGSAVDMNGSISLTGADAHAAFQTGSLDISGAISLVGSGHDITTQITSNFGTASITSSNNAGHARLLVGGLNSPDPATTVNLGGTLSLSGIGSALVEIQGKNITTRGIDIDATAASYTRSRNGTLSQSGRGEEDGPFDNESEEGEGPQLLIDEGSFIGAEAGLFMAGGSSCTGSPCSFQLLPATSVQIDGPVSVSGQGFADIGILANSISITGSITAAGGAGTVNGTGTDTVFDSTTSTSYDVAITQQGDIGHARVELLTPGGSITVGGGIVMTGLTGRIGVDADSGSVSLQGISLSGAGGVFSESKVFTATSGPGSDFSTSFEGPAERTLGQVSGGNVSITGDINVSGAAVAGMMIGGLTGAPVVNGNISITGTNAVVTQFDSRDMSSPSTATYGNAALLIGEMSNGLVIGPGSINGNVTLTADQNAHLLINGDISGTLGVNATGNIDTILPAIYQDDDDPDALPAVTLSVTAGGLNLTAGNAIDLGSGGMNVSAGQNIGVTAGGSINFGSTSLNTSLLLDISAGGDISNAAGTFSAGGLSLVSGGNINLSGTGFTIGSGSAGVAGDPTATTEFGLGNPSGYISAAGNLDLGALTFNGSYLWLEAGDFGALGATSLAAGATVQLSANGTDTVLDTAGATGAGVISADYAGLFSGAARLMVGRTDTTADVLVGPNGAVDLTGLNLALLSGGNILGSNLLTADALHLVLTAGATADLLTSTALITANAGSSITLDNSAFTGAASLGFGAGSFGALSASFGGDVLVSSGFTGTGFDLSTPGSATLTGAISAPNLISAGTLVLDGTGVDFSLTTNTGAITVNGANNVTLDNSAFTGAASLGFGAGSFGALSASFGGDVLVSSGFTGTGFDLSTPGSLSLSNADYLVSGAAILDVGGSFAATGALLSAGAVELIGSNTTDFSLATSTASVTIQAANNVTLDNSAFTGAASLSFGAGTFGDLALTMGGDTQLSSVTANNLGMAVNNGSLDASGAVIEITNDLNWTVDQNVLLASTSITSGTIEIVAGGNISDLAQGGALTKPRSTGTSRASTISADAVLLVAGGDILLESTDLSIGSGNIAGIAGDASLLAGLAAAGIAPASDAPNAIFVAAGSLGLGSVSIAGGYGYFEAGDMNFTGSITGPANLLVQFVPFGGTGNLTLENTAASGGSLNLDSADLLAVQEGATIALGDSAYAGNMSLGQNGTVNLGARNFIVATSGEVDSLDNITSTGLVKSLEQLLNPDTFDEPLIEEIDEDYQGSERFGIKTDDEETGDEEGEDTDGDGVPDTEGGDSLIKHESSEETSGMCKA